MKKTSLTLSLLLILFSGGAWANGHENIIDLENQNCSKLYENTFKCEREDGKTAYQSCSLKADGTSSCHNNFCLTTDKSKSKFVYWCMVEIEGSNEVITSYEITGEMNQDGRFSNRVIVEIDNRRYLKNSSSFNELSEKPLGIAENVIKNYKDRMCLGDKEFWNDCLGTISSIDGSVYKGEFTNGLPHGKGSYNWSDGSSYFGEFKEGKLNGKGTFKRLDGTELNGYFLKGEFLETDFSREDKGQKVLKESQEAIKESKKFSNIILEAVVSGVIQGLVDNALNINQPCTPTTSVKTSPNYGVGGGTRVRVKTTTCPQ